MQDLVYHTRQKAHGNYAEVVQGEILGRCGFGDHRNILLFDIVHSIDEGLSTDPTDRRVIFLTALLK